MRLQLLVLTCVAALVGASAQAALVHRYSFTTDASDSVGTAHGTLVGTGGSFTGGQVVLDGNGVGTTDFNPPTAGGAYVIPAAGGAFVDLPNYLVSTAAASGQAGAVTIEMWATVAEHRDWAALFTAGLSAEGENRSGGDNSNFPYIQIIPRTGDGGAGNDLRATTNSFFGPEGFVDDPAAGGTDMAVNMEEHLVLVLDQSGGLPGTITLYRNGVLYDQTRNIAPNLDLKNVPIPTFPVIGLNDVNVWLGKSMWGDRLFDGSINELRIYDHALTAGDVSLSNQGGPGGPAVPEPATIALAALALVGLVARRR